MERQQQGNPRFGQLRGGVGYDGTHDDNEGEVDYNPQASGDEYGRGAVSMQTLNSRGGMKGRVWGGRYRKDVDRSGEDGEAESFEVSSDEEHAVDEPASPPAPGARRDGVQRGWSRDWE